MIRAGRDDSEHHLKDHEELMGDGGGVVGVGLHAHADEGCPAEVPYESAMVGPEGQSVAEQHPLDAHHPQQHEALHHDGEDVLASDQSTVEESQPWSHQHHQCGGDDHPGGVSGVDLRHLQPPFVCPTDRRRSLGRSAETTLLTPQLHRKGGAMVTAICITIWVFACTFVMRPRARRAEPVGACVSAPSAAPESRYPMSRLRALSPSPRRSLCSVGTRSAR